MTSTVMIFAMLAGATSSSAAFSNRTVPVSESIRMACGASVWNPWAATGEAAGMAAAVIARSAAAASAAEWRAWNEVRNAWTGRARILKRLTSGEPELCAFAPAKSTSGKDYRSTALRATKRCGFMSWNGSAFANRARGGCGGA